MNAGARLRVNDEIMPHKLMQQAGLKLALVRANMNHLSAVASVKLTAKGTYRFTTKPGEDYGIFVGRKTIGEDYVLHLTVHVK
jgi:hypothetical protein